jgi:adhesin/invasin
LVVKVTDALGRGVTGVVLTWTVATGGGSVSASSTTTDVSGQSSVSWTLGTSVGSNSVSASATGLAAVTFSASAVAGPAAKLSFTVQPGNATAGAGISPAAEVAIQDAYGNAATSSVLGITVAIGSGTGKAGAHLQGPTTVSATNGVATFSGLSIDSAATGYRLTAAATGLSGVTSATFNITPGTASQLVWTQQPGNVVAGAPVSPAVALTVADAQGNSVTTASGTVTLALTAANGATLSGGGPATVVNGVATFSALSVNKSGSYTLTPSTTVSGVTTRPVSGGFAVSAGAATQIAVDAGNGQSATAGTAVAVPPSVIVRDANNNPVAGVNVTFAVASGGGTVVPTTAVLTNASGIAQVTSWTLGATAGSNTLSATSAGLTGSPLTFTAAGTTAATQIAINGGNGQSAAAGTTVAVPPSVIVRDASNNPVSGVSVTFAVATGGGTVVPTTAVVTNASGIAQATSWTLGATAGSNTLTATSTGLTGSPVTFTAAGTVGTAAKLALTTPASGAFAGAAFTTQPVLAIKDAANNTVTSSIASVTMSVSAGATTVGTVTVNAVSGVATFTNAGITGTAGTQYTLTFASTGLTSATQNITPTGPSHVVAFAGGNGPGLVGYAVNVRPAVRVTDASNNPVPGASVAFAVASGGGNVSGGATTTNSNGVAQVGAWTLGAVAGTNTLTATVTGTGITGNPVTFADTGYAAGYDIQIQYYGPTPSATIQAAMNAAVAKWQSVIYRPLVAVPLNVPAGTCKPGTPAVSQTINNVLILATFDSIDGPGNGVVNTVGQGAPCYVRVSPLQPTTALGTMVFDTADIAVMISDGTLTFAMVHEMGHALGFGTLWNLPAQFTNPNCLQLSSTPPGTINDTYFSCAKGRAAFDSVGGTSYTGGGSSPPAGNKVPLENCGTAPYVSPACGNGTVNSHWREVVMTNELMTGYYAAGANPLSIVSIAAMEDIGYIVNYAAADSYAHLFTARAAVGRAPVSLGDDIYQGPLYGVDASGKVVRVGQVR